MNGTIVNNISQTLYSTYPTLLPVISSKQVQIETNKEQIVRHYNELIITIIKVMGIQYITHCTNEEY